MKRAIILLSIITVLAAASYPQRVHVHPTKPNKKVGTVVTDRYLSVPEGEFPTANLNTPMVDRTFGLMVNTIADKTFDGGTDTSPSKPSVEYSHLSAFNANSTRVWVNNGGGVFVADFDPSTLLVSNWQRVSNFRTESFYFTNDPNVGCSTDMATQTKVLCRNFATNITTILKDFAGIINPGSALKQMSVSEDNDDTFAFTYYNGLEEKDCLVWKRSTNSVLIDRLPGDPDLNECHVNDNGEFVILYGYDSTAKVIDLTTSIGYDLGRFWPDNAGTAVGGHGDICRDGPVGTDADSLNIYRSRWTDLRTSIQAFRENSEIIYRSTSYAQGLHLSCRGGRWALVSFYDASNLFPWEVTTNELVLIDTLVPFQIKRVQKGRGYRGTGNWDYWEVYKGSISRDGRFIAFTTNNKLTGRTFVMVTKLNG